MQNNQEIYDEKEYSSIGSPFLFNKTEAKDESGLRLPESNPYPIYTEHYPSIHMDSHPVLHLHQPHDYYADTHHPYGAYDAIPHYMPGPDPYTTIAQPSRNPAYEEEKVLICPHDNCGKHFKKQSTYHSHLKTHTNTAKPFLCRICSFSFSRSHDLKRHEYIHSKDKPFLCTGCQRGFSRRDALKRHLDSMKNRPGGCGGNTKKKD